MSFCYPELDLLEGNIPSREYSSEFVSKAMARMVEPIDPIDPERYPADLKIKRGSLEVEAHSHILCQESHYFKVLCKGGFLEEMTQELKLHAEEEFPIRRLLCYCYTTGYNDEPYDNENDPPRHFKAPAYINRLYMKSEMYSTAEKYDIPGLKAKAATKFDATTRDGILRDGIDPHTGFSVVDEIVEAVPHIYSSTPDRERRLRDRAIQVVLLYHKEVQVQPSLRDLIATVPDFFEEPRIKSSGLESKISRIDRMNSAKKFSLDG